MGFYIPGPLRKITTLLELGAEELMRTPRTMDEIPPGKALIVVIDNGRFDAALFVWCEKERSAALDDPDERPRWCFLLDWKIACRESGFKPELHGKGLV